MKGRRRRRRREVSREPCKLCTRCRVRESPKIPIEHRDRSPPSPPSSLLVVSFGQSHFTSKHAQVTREKLFICFWSRLFVQNRWRHFGHVVTSRTWWRREMTYAFCAREIERIPQVCACGGGICLCVWTKWQAYVRKKTGTDFLL